MEIPTEKPISFLGASCSYSIVITVSSPDFTSPCLVQNTRGSRKKQTEKLSDHESTNHSLMCVGNLSPKEIINSMLQLEYHDLEERFEKQLTKTPVKKAEILEF